MDNQHEVPSAVGIAPPPVPWPPAPGEAYPVKRRRGAAGRVIAGAAVLTLAGGALVAHALTGSPASPASPPRVIAGPQWQSGGPSGRAGSGAAPADVGQTVTRTASAAQQAGVVDIDTVIGYQRGRAAGTGMVLTPTGEVLTNAHVVAGATSITVTVTTTGRTYDATVVGSDPSDDVAVVQLQGASDLATVHTATAGVSVGDAVTGVGNAGGEGGTPSAAPGQVIGVDRTITATDENGSNPETLSGLIETDAAIEPGDSGGPLLNSSDQVVGMDSAGAASGAREGYAIPIGTALTLARQIESGQAQDSGQTGGGQGATQSTSSAFLGVEIQSDLPGATVAAVVPGSPASTTDLAPGDRITSLDGHPVQSISDLSSVLGSLSPGQQATVTWVDPYGLTGSSTVTLTSAAS